MIHKRVPQAKGALSGRKVALELDLVDEWPLESWRKGRGTSTQPEGMPSSCESVDRSLPADVGRAGPGLPGDGRLCHAGSAQGPRPVKSGI